MVFGWISWLKINLNKGTLLGINMNQALASLLKNSGVFEWPITYLGLPLEGNPRAVSFWDSVIDRIFKQLDGWKKAFLYFGGRITLATSCLSLILTRYLIGWQNCRDISLAKVGGGNRDNLIG